MLTVVTGGARSGKSTVALQLAVRSGAAVAFVATCPRIDGDEELAERIRNHRVERPSGWKTIEEEHDLASAVAVADGSMTVVIDCLTLWVSNLLHRGDGADAVDHACRNAIEVVTSRSGLTIAVTNEVGLGIVPADSSVRTYRDALGRVNQAWVSAADHALFLVAGRAIPLHDPFELLP